MPKSDNQKQKLLHIEQLFRTQTDEAHTVTVSQIIEYLEQRGIRAERKSIYSDLKTLCDFGLDIIKGDGPRDGYRLASREFELAEVKLLVDLVQSARFITEKKSRELIAKLEGLASHWDAGRLHRQVVVADRAKSVNESIYYSVDVIHTAIAGNVQVRFQYFDWNAKKERTLRKNGAFYQVSPWLLTFDDENYYLVAYDSAAALMKHYRVDKMLCIETACDFREGRDIYETIDVAAYSRKTFGMFAGTERTLQLLCHSSLAGVMIDRFGPGIAIRPFDSDRILVRVTVSVSPQFFGWLAGLSRKAVIHAPADVAAEYRSYLLDILQEITENTPTGKENITMALPTDPILLLGVVNTQLRDHYPTLDELAKAHMTDPQAIIEKLAAVNYRYDADQNQFR